MLNHNFNSIQFSSFHFILLHACLTLIISFLLSKSSLVIIIIVFITSKSFKKNHQKNHFIIIIFIIVKIIPSSHRFVSSFIIKIKSKSFPFSMCIFTVRTNLWLPVDAPVSKCDGVTFFSVDVCWAMYLCCVCCMRVCESQSPCTSVLPLLVVALFHYFGTRSLLGIGCARCVSVVGVCAPF